MTGKWCVQVMGNREYRISAIGALRSLIDTRVDGAVKEALLPLVTGLEQAVYIPPADGKEE